MADAAQPAPRRRTRLSPTYLLPTMGYFLPPERINRQDAALPGT